MRVNPELKMHQHPCLKTDKATGDSKRIYGGRGAGAYAARKPLGYTPPPTHNTLKDLDNYSTGMGDEFHQPQRPGSDHSHILSRGSQC